MVKRISLARRRPDLTRAEFAAHWLGPHSDIARSIPGLRGYRINLSRDPDSVWDGVAETWFDSEEEAVAAFNTEPIKGLMTADRPKFLDEVIVFIADEHVVVEPPTGR